MDFKIPFTQDLVREYISHRNGPFWELIPFWAFMLLIFIILLSIGLLLEAFLHIFMDSRNLKVLKVVMYFITAIVVAIPFSVWPTELIVSTFRDRTEYDTSIIYFAFFYALISRIIIYAVGFSYCKMLEKPRRNCRVLLCEVSSENGYDVKEIVLKRHTFNQCYTFIRNRNEDIAPGQFYQIKETTFFGLIKIGSWNYYRDGSVIHDNDFMAKMFRAQVDKEKKIQKKYGDTVIQMKSNNESRQQPERAEE